MSYALNRANELRASANQLGKRQSSFALYKVLQECMILAERIAAEPVERDALHTEFIGQSTGGNRRFIEKSSDENMLVCRYVFHDEDDKGKRNAAWRYGVSLKTAKDMGYTSNSIYEVLSTKGGINTFFQRRKQPNPLVRAKVLRLTKQIEIPSDKTFTLTLRRLPDNAFEVEVMEVA